MARGRGGGPVTGPVRSVALFLPSAGGGGAERVGVTLAGALARRGVRVHLVLARAQGEYLPLVDPAVEVVDLRAPRVLAATPALTWWLRSARPDVLLAGLSHANVVAVLARAAARTATRLVLWEQNTLTAKVRMARRARTRLLMTPAMRATYRAADDLVAVSAGVADDLAAVLSLPAGRVRVVANPAVTADLARRAAKPLDDPWFAPGAPPVLLSVGRLEPHKRLDLLLDAVAPLVRDRAARLLILGEGVQRPALERRVAELGLRAGVRLPGFVDPYPCMARAAVYVLASDHEGLPTALIEALALGTRVVATDCPSGPREILDGGRHGRLVPTGDAPALRAAIRATLADPGPPPPASAWAAYTEDAAADQMLAVLAGAR